MLHATVESLLVEYVERLDSHEYDPGILGAGEAGMVWPSIITTALNYMGLSTSRKLAYKYNQRRVPDSFEGNDAKLLQLLPHEPLYTTATIWTSYA